MEINKARQRDRKQFWVAAGGRQVKKEDILSRGGMFQHPERMVMTARMTLDTKPKPCYMPRSVLHILHV